MKTTKYIFFILFLLISKELSFSRENAVVYLKKDVVISNSCIYLKDIIQNCSGIDSEKINNLYVSKAPLPKHKIIISGKFIKLLLKREGINDIQVVGDKTTVVSSYQYLKIEDILNTIKSYIIKQYKSESIDVSLYSVTEERLSNLVLPQGEIKLRIDEARKNKPCDDLGLVFLPLLVYINDEFYTKMNIGVILKDTKKIITAAKDIPGGNIISKDDIELKEYKIIKRMDYIYDIRDVIGKKLKLKKTKGELILYSDLKQEYVIKASEPVKIILRDKNLTIEVEGIACSSANLHEKIKVKNISSGKIIEGIVIDKGIVKISF